MSGYKEHGSEHDTEYGSEHDNEYGSEHDNEYNSENVGIAGSRIAVVTKLFSKSKGSYIKVEGCSPIWNDWVERTFNYTVHSCHDNEYGLYYDTRECRNARNANDGKCITEDIARAYCNTPHGGVVISAHSYPEAHSDHSAYSAHSYHSAHSYPEDHSYPKGEDISFSIVSKSKFITKDMYTYKLVPNISEEDEDISFSVVSKLKFVTEDTYEYKFIPNIPEDQKYVIHVEFISNPGHIRKIRRCYPKNFIE
jgi:hypothetical protein